MAFGSSVLTHKKEQQIKIEGEFKPTVDCLCATRRGLVCAKKDLGGDRGMKSKKAVQHVYSNCRRSAWPSYELHQAAPRRPEAVLGSEQLADILQRVT